MGSTFLGLACENGPCAVMPMGPGPPVLPSRKRSFLPRELISETFFVLMVLFLIIRVEETVWD